MLSLCLFTGIYYEKKIMILTRNKKLTLYDHKKYYIFLAGIDDHFPSDESFIIFQGEGGEMHSAEKNL